jgi:ATP-dependent RNA helicase DeaD
MQFLNKNVRGHVEVGHIDLLTTISYFEVPEEDAERVIKYVNGQRYKNREVRCNDAEETAPARETRYARPTRDTRSTRDTRKPREPKPSKAPKDVRIYQKDEWMQFLNPNGMKAKGAKPHADKKPKKDKGSRELKGEIPDFSEEGWAIRKPRKKK